MDWKPDTAWSALPSVSRDDLPLLFASVEHRAWTAAVESFLRGEREALPLIHHQCSFGAWLENEGQALHRGQPAYLASEALHRRIHERAAELLALRNDGRLAEALARLGELYELRDALLEQLQVLVMTSK